jgi:uncharacterized membrane protein
MRESMSPENSSQPVAIAIHNGNLSIGKHRIEALADGLFAIVMTLLVLELRVPDLPHHLSNAELMHELAPMWRVLFSFVLTFFLASMFWMSQQAILTATRTLDKFGAALHLTAMMFVAFMPFSTAMLGRYISNGFAMSLYFGNQTVVSLLLCAAWLRERHNRNVGELPAGVEKKITLKNHIDDGDSRQCGGHGLFQSSIRILRSPARDRGFTHSSQTNGCCAMIYNSAHDECLR